MVVVVVVKIGDCGIADIVATSLGTGSGIVLTLMSDVLDQASLSFVCWLSFGAVPRMLVVESIRCDNGSMIIVVTDVGLDCCGCCCLWVDVVVPCTTALDVLE